MISWFLSKNKTRTTTCDELVDVLVQNKDLLYKEGITNIGGINLYHFKNDNDAAEFSYGSVSLTVAKLSGRAAHGRAVVGISTIDNKNDLLECLLREEDVYFTCKNGGGAEVPISAFESDVDFFQYTLLNLQYECSDASLIKLIKFISEFINEQSK